MKLNSEEGKIRDKIEFDGFEIYHTQEGQGLPALVIGSHIYYPRTFSENLREHLQLIFLDQRAFAKKTAGLVSTKDAFALSKILDDMEAVRLKLNLDKVIVIGHSIHAFIALEYAKKYPDSVSRLILIASSPITGNKLYESADKYFNESVCPERKAQLATNLTTLDQDLAANPDQAFIIRMLKFGPMIWYDYTYDAHHLWEGVHLDPIGAAFVWGGMFENYQIEKNLDALQCPVLLALGRYDYWNPPHVWEDVRTKFADLTIRVFEKSAHSPQLEEGVLFDEELLKWLGKG